MSAAPCIPLLAERAVHFDTRLCVGLDPVRERIPPLLENDPDPVLAFCRGIVDATAEHALAFKPNAAFFESEGAAGWERLEALVAHIPDHIPVILDAKRGDIGSSSRGYARMAFEQLGADAVTVNPYMGRDSLDPFLAYTDRGIFVLAATSNPGADDFQSLQLRGGETLVSHIARTVVSWNEHGNIGLVVGATRPERMREVREVAPDLPFLIPGVGAQGGDPRAFMAAALDRAGGGVIVVASRSILYTEDPDFQQGASEAAGRLRQQLNRAREEALDVRT